jgi:uncharacterized protein YcbK (DUF882 family)
MNYFTEAELKCQHCGKYEFDAGFLAILNRIRADCGFPLVVTSGYRCVDHPIEAKKDQPGAHTRGCAIDVQVSGWKAYRLLEVAMRRGVKRIGVNQTGPHSKRFIHLDTAIDLPMPAIWSY